MSEFGIQNLFNPVAPKEGRMSGPQATGVGLPPEARWRSKTCEGGVEGVSPEVAISKEGGERDTKYPQPGEKGKEMERCQRKLAAPPKVPSCHTQGHSPLYSLSDSSTACYPCLLRSRGILEVPNHGDFPEGSSSLFCIWAL